MFAVHSTVIQIEFKMYKMMEVLFSDNFICVL